MAEPHSSRRLTRADVLVAAITCLLLILLVPVLFAKPREASVRRLCAANLTQIGKAMLVYANDYEDELPRAGGRNTVWGGLSPTGWTATDRRTAFGLTPDSSGGKATITSCFYLLIKYSEVTPKSFVCKGDAGTTEFKLSDQISVPTTFELIDAWDFGAPTESYKHCSYTYHMPFGLYALTTSNEPSMAVAADRNPWLKSPAAEAAKWNDFRPDVPGSGYATGSSDTAKKGNAIAHQNDGQNVLFLDSHVEFAKRAYCSIEDDNIYTISRGLTGGADIYGVGGVLTPGPNCKPANRKDSLLVHDPSEWGGR